MPKPPAPKKTVDAFRHDDKRRNIPTAEYVSLVEKGTQAERKPRYPRDVDRAPRRGFFTGIHTSLWRVAIKAA